MMSLTPIASQTPTISPVEQEDYDNLFLWSQASKRIGALIKEWTDETFQTERRRKMRDLEVDVTRLQKDGRLKSDETLIPIRVIDTNISKEQPTYINYITQSRRLAIFNCRDNPTVDTSLLEKDFTEGMSYSEYQTPIFKTLDGAMAHGWDFVEIEFRQDRPLHCNVDHIGHENLIFPRDAKDIQACELVIRKYKLSVLQLRKFVKDFGFSGEQVELLIAQQRNLNTPTNVDVYKCYFKWQGVVFVAWHCEKESTDWLKPPGKLFLGRSSKVVTPSVVSNNLPLSFQQPLAPPQISWEPINETQYPIVIYKYRETEKDAITDYKGRVFLDGAKQEARTALWSIFINGSVRAGNVYGSPANPQGTGGMIKKLDLTLEHGCFYSEPMNFWHTEYPDAEIVRADNALDSETQDETGNLSAAVVNREDSRKTAKEISTANTLTSMLGSVRLLLFSIFLREVWSRCWLIVQSQAQQGLVTLPQTPPEIVAYNYDVKAAGDIDVVERAEKLNRRSMLWPIVSNTPLAMVFLQDIIKESFPEDADRYGRVLAQMQMAGQQQQSVIQGLSGVLKEVVTDDTGGIKPEFKQYAPQLNQLAQQVSQVLGGGAQQGNGQMGQKPPAMQQQ